MTPGSQYNVLQQNSPAVVVTPQDTLSAVATTSDNVSLVSTRIKDTT